jgi:hypothetical protein
VIFSIWTAHVKDWLVYGLLLGLVILHKRESDGLFDHSVTGIEAPVIGVWDERNCGLLLSLFHSQVKEVFWML